jgi:predicted dehydrogenase
MLRLAILGEEADACLKLAPRLPTANLINIRDINELESDDFDAVVVCSATKPEDDCRFAAAHGKHVLLTTPPASSKQATALMQECRTRDVRLMVGFSDRFRPSVQAIKQSLDSGQLGDPGLIRVHRWCSPRSHATELSSAIDLAIWMFQAMPTEVYAVERGQSDDYVDFLQVHLGFPNGGMGLIDVSEPLWSADGYSSLSLIGSTGAAYADDHHNQQLLFRGEHALALKTGGGDAARLAQLRDFVDAISEHREPSVTGTDAAAALLVCGAALQSIKHGATARWSGEHYEC